MNNTNKYSKEWLLKSDNRDILSKAITYHIYRDRSGPMEKLHCKYQISDTEMEELNKFTINRIAGLLSLMDDNKWSELAYYLISTAGMFCKNWDKSEPDCEGFDFPSDEVYREFAEAIRLNK